MSTSRVIRDTNAKFEATIPDCMPEIFSDGVSQLLLGTPNSKLTFHTLITPANHENEFEQRQGVLRLTIPTPVLLELCRNILVAAQGSVSLFSEGGKTVDTEVKKILNGVSINVPDQGDARK